MPDEPAHKVLAQLFQTIVNEAERNPRFADQMLEALPEQIKQKSQSPVKEPPAKEIPTKKAFDPKAYNPLVMYRQRGEDLMKLELKKLTHPNLKAVVKHFKLKLTSHLKTKSPNKAALVTAIVAFSKHYDTQRKGAAK